MPPGAGMSSRIRGPQGRCSDRHAPFADESIADGVDLTRTAIETNGGQTVVAGLSLGNITTDAVQRSLDAARPPREQVSRTRKPPTVEGAGALTLDRETED
jgi:hypothetical protein